MQSISTISRCWWSNEKHLLHTEHLKARHSCRYPSSLEQTHHGRIVTIADCSEPQISPKHWWDSSPELSASCAPDSTWEWPFPTEQAVDLGALWICPSWAMEDFLGADTQLVGMSLHCGQCPELITKLPLKGMRVVNTNTQARKAGGFSLPWSPRP
jgi:hypothetical protein